MKAFSNRVLSASIILWTSGFLHAASLKPTGDEIKTWLDGRTIAVEQDSGQEINYRMEASKIKEFKASRLKRRGVSKPKEGDTEVIWYTGKITFLMADKQKTEMTGEIGYWLVMPEKNFFLNYVKLRNVTSNSKK